MRDTKTATKKTDTMTEALLIFTALLILYISINGEAFNIN